MSSPSRVRSGGQRCRRPKPGRSRPRSCSSARYLGEFAEAVRDLRRETDTERRERVDDLAVLIDLITKGREGLDLPSRSDVSTVVFASTREEPTARRIAPSRPSSAPRTSSVLGEAATEAEPEPAREAEPSTVPARATAPRSSSFRPSRTWAWPPVSGADYYLVEFFRAGARIYRARPTQPQLRLPAAVVFTSGAYRWTVRAGFGEPAERNLRSPIVDSGFTIGD